MKKRPLILFMLAVSVVALVLLPTTLANKDGRGNGDFEYGCGPCHTVESGSSIVMEASDSDLILEPGQTVTIYVNVTGGETTGNILGVMIASSTSSSDSLPSDKGWTILSDPTGSDTNNYYEIDTYNGQLSVSWSLQAPQATDEYFLIAREFHGFNDQGYFKDSDGLTFLVGTAPTPGEAPTVFINSPEDGATVDGRVKVSSSVISTENISYVTLSMDGDIIFNSSSAPYSWNIETDTYSDGEHELKVTAADETGKVGSKTITVTIDNSSERIQMLNWIATIVASVALVIMICGVMIVIALLIRRRVMGPGRG